MIKILNLKKSFNDQEVLKDVNMHIRPGKLYGLVGSNGCGKTTVFKHIMGLYKGKGQILYNNHSIDEKGYLEKIYYVQDDLFFPLNYTLDNLYEYESMYYPKMQRKKYEQLIAFFKIDTSKKLRSLSKGQKKQAAFILAVSSMTETLILDEIVDGLDAVVRKKFWEVLMTEIMDRSLTVIISSHALTELDNVCDTIGILHDGVIVREDEMDKIKEETKRVQYAIKDELSIPENDLYSVLSNKLIGKVYFAVIKGDLEVFKEALYEHNKVLLFEELTMNLEEVFISELGNLGYGGERYE